MKKKKVDSRQVELAKKWLDGTINKEEKEEFAIWFAAGQEDEIKIPLAIAKDEETHRKRLLASIKRKRALPKERFTHPVLRLAAAIVILLGFAWIWHQWMPQRQSLSGTATLTHATKILPGKDMAYLILGDGRRLTLEDGSSGLVAEGTDFLISKDSSHALTYLGDHKSQAMTEASEFHTLITPRGGKYRVILPDQTVVWLNAASSLRYPVQFTGNVRKVELTGEAYFEVNSTPHPLPFIVATPEQEITVLGTKFNVQAYTDEVMETTTLKEGRVSVSGKQTNALLLQPGEKSEVIRQGEKQTIRKSKADLEEALAWQEGYFYFNNMNIQGVMRQIARWYDIDVVYLNKEKSDKYAGKIPRNAKLSDVLQTLKTTGISFEIEGRVLSVL